MMDRYMLFRKLMDTMAEDWEILEANMISYSKEMEIQGRCLGWEFSLRVIPVEVKEDAQELE